MTLKKLFSLFIAAIFLCSVFVGCKPVTEDESNSNNTAQQTPQQPTKTEPDENTTVTINFTKSTCKNGSTSVYSGRSIKVNTVLTFTASLTNGYVVENWSVNGEPQENETENTFTYTVHSWDATETDGKYSLTVSYTTKTCTTTIIEFGENITCTKDSVEVKSGDTVQVKDYLRFAANLGTDEIIENWYINNVKQTYNTSSTMSYTVSTSDIVAGKITISFVAKDAAKATVEFDSTVTCQKSLETIASGTEIKEGDYLRFTAVLEEGKIVENWYINDVKQKYETSSFMGHTIEASDIVDGKVKISFVAKDAAKATIEFDSTVTCQKSLETITSGTKIQEGDYLKFTAVLGTGEVLANWYINDVKQNFETNSSMSHTVSASDIKDGKIKISFKKVE